MPRLLALFLVVAWAASCALAYARVIPHGEAPDERTHAQIIQFIVEEGRTPVLGKDAGFGVTIASAEGLPKQEGPWRYPYLSMAGQPGGHYFIAAAVSGGGAEDWPARWVGAVYAALLACTVYLLVRLLAGAGEARAHALGLTAALLVASWPQLIYLFAYVNTDGFSVVAATLAVTGLAWGVWSGWSTRAAIALGAALGLMSIGKMTGFPPALVIAGAATVSAIRSRRAVRSLLAGVGACIAVGAWWWVGAIGRYGVADPLGYGWAHREFERLDAKLPSAQNLGLGFVEMLTQTRFAPKLAAGTFGVFQGESVLPIALFLGPTILGIGALVGLVLCRRSPSAESHEANGLPTRPAPGPYTVAGWTVCAAFILQLAFVTYLCYFNEFQPQGRYLTPLVPAAVALGVVVIDRGLAPRAALGVLAVASISTIAAAVLAVPTALAASVDSAPGAVVDALQPWFAASWILIGLGAAGGALWELATALRRAEA